MSSALRVTLLLLVAAAAVSAIPRPDAEKVEKADQVADKAADKATDKAADKDKVHKEEAAPANDPAPTVVGAKKFATAVDCSGAVAFSSVGAAATKELGKLKYATVLTDKSVGWSRDSGEFTTFCPGLYQFAFSGGDINARLALRKKATGEKTTWDTVVPGAVAASSVLLDMDVGDQVAIFLEEGELSEDAAPSTTFSGFRIARK